MPSLNPTIKPRALRPGSTIAFLSPSARINEPYSAVIRRAITLLESHSFKVITLWTPSALTPNIASTIAARKSELLGAFTDPSVSAIICTIGGSTATELLASLLHDPEALATLRSNPKLFIGCSDITVLHYLLASLGLRTLYGPTAIPQLGDVPTADPFTVSHFLSVAQNHSPPGPVPRSETYTPLVQEYFLTDPASTIERSKSPTPPWKWLRSGRAEGPLFGGCLHIVVRLQGVAAVAPDWTGRILFVETAASDGPGGIKLGYPLDRFQAALADLAAMGVLDVISGLVIGRAYGYNTPESRERLEKMVRELICEGGGEVGVVRNAKEFPVLMHVDVGRK